VVSAASPLPAAPAPVQSAPLPLPPSDSDDIEEDDLLDKAWGLELTSRLSCQARMKDKPIVIEIPKYTLNQVSEAKR